MLIAQVIGEVVASHKHESHFGQKLLLVQPLDLDEQPQGTPYIALDAVDAGVGDRVLLATDGYAAMTAVNRPQSPIDAAILAIVDQVNLDT